MKNIKPGTVGLESTVDIHYKTELIYIQINMRYESTDNSLIIDENMDSIICKLGDKELNLDQTVELTKLMNDTLLCEMVPSVKCSIIDQTNNILRTLQKIDRDVREFDEITLYRPLVLRYKDGKLTIN